MPWLNATAQVKGKYIFANPLFLKPCSAAVFMPFMEKEFPELAESYRQRYQDKAFLPKAYGEGYPQLMQRLRAKYGIHNSYERYEKSASALKKGRATFPVLNVLIGDKWRLVTLSRNSTVGKFSGLFQIDTNCQLSDKI